MKSHGYHLKNNFSNTSNSKINIYKQLKKYNNLKYNYCSSIYKDSGQLLTSEKIHISKEQTPESFCNSFFICSFPYKKILLENIL